MAHVLVDLTLKFSAQVFKTKMEQICGALRMFYSSTQLNSELDLYLSFGLNSYSRADFEQIEI